MDRIHVINNLSDNHYKQIVEIAQNADTLYIVSPFLMESFDTIFCEFKETNIRTIHLVTTLRSHDIDLLRKANFLNSFCRLCEENKIKFKIYINNKLHGKIYVASKNNKYISGILTSANFTESGLSHNHEWGLKIEEPKILETLIKQVLEVCSNSLSIENIYCIIKKVDKYFKINKEISQFKPNISIDEFLDFDKNVQNKRFFIKPVGYSGEPYTANEKLDSDIATLHFSRRRPSAVRVGDILICYAVGSTKLLGYFEVITQPTFFGDDDRWPWSVKGKNLCPAYSESWMHYNNTLATIKETFSIDTPITYIGGKTLGALNFGSDKIRLTEIFANHIIKIIERDAKKRIL